ncbi:hypothetical protein [Gulosibacter bifidus]|uniref:Uncharacterized protein n=1 Tax=Gulosibacter bifidus TaxID=272239 RepID=A0ABW5RI82_9MICO|nr:hypothetical protein [Gulosibacter bifidus]
MTHAIIPNQTTETNTPKLPVNLSRYEVCPIVNSPFDAPAPVERNGFQERYTAAIVIDEAKHRVVVYPANRPVDRPSTLIYLGEALCRGDWTPPYGWKRTKSGHLIGYVIEFDAIEKCELNACDEFNESFFVGDHMHHKASHEVAGLSFPLWMEEADGWRVDHYFEREDKGPLTVAEARSYIQALTAAVDEMEALNGRMVRRPIDHCAEPSLDGIGGGL